MPLGTVPLAGVKQMVNHATITRSGCLTLLAQYGIDVNALQPKEAPAGHPQNEHVFIDLPHFPWEVRVINL